MSGKLRNMTAIYLLKGDKVLLLYRQGGRVVNDVWTGSANSVVLTRPNTGSGHWRLQSVEVTCGTKAITINTLDLRFGIKVPMSDWNDLTGIEDYGVMMYLTTKASRLTLTA